MYLYWVRRLLRTLLIFGVRHVTFPIIFVCSFSISLKGWFYVLSFTFNCLRFSSWGVVALVLGLKLNPIYPQIPLGTVTVNLVGGFIIGFAMAYFAHSDLSPNYKLFVITGFCGALTTFSTFSIEIVTLLQSGKWGMAMLAISIHLIGSLIFTCLGLAAYYWVAGH